MESCESMLERRITRLKSLLVERKSIREKSVKSLLKISESQAKKIVLRLQEEGFLKIRREKYKGRAVNTLFPIKQENAGKSEDNPGKWWFMEESPCFFCSRLDTCGSDHVINAINCPRLNDWVLGSKVPGLN